MLRTILIVILILLLIGALPTWPYSSDWGYYPGGGIGLILVIVLNIGLSRTDIAAITTKIRARKSGRGQRECTGAPSPAFAPRERPAAAQAY